MKKILLVHDLFSSATDIFIKRCLSLLQDDQVIVPELPIQPSLAMNLLKDICEKEHPDIIVGWLSGAFLAQQFADYDRVLISPDYQISTTLDIMCDEDNGGHIPYLFERCDGQKQITITPQLIQEYLEMEQRQFDGVHNSPKAVFGFFWVDQNEDNLRLHAAHYADVTYLPGKNYLDDASIKAICDSINCWLHP